MRLSSSDPPVITRRYGILYICMKLRHMMSLVWVHSQICWRLLCRLLGFLVRGSKVWIVMTLRLIAFVILLAPGWVALMRYYVFDSFIIRNIEYGKGAKYRNLLDVYLPRPYNPGAPSQKRKRQGQVPVIVFVSGGAWIIGYKLWSALMGREFARQGYVVIVPDYRNFPQGNIEDMMDDLRGALQWTICNCSMFGGDPNRIMLSGQSAGAHISLCALVELYEESQRQRRSTDEADTARLGVIQNTPAIVSAVPIKGNDVPGIPTPITGSSARSCRSSSEGDGGSFWWDVDSSPNSCEGTPVDASHSSDVLPELQHTNSDDDSADFLDTRDCADTPDVGLNCDPALDTINSEVSSPPTRTRSASSPLPHPLPQELNMLGQTEYSSNLINETAMHNMDFYARDLHISDIKMFIGISGPYNMVRLLHHMHLRGLDASILHIVFNSDVSRYSPVQRLAAMAGLPPPKIQGEEDDNSVLRMTYNSFYAYIFGVEADMYPAQSSVPGMSGLDAITSTFSKNVRREHTESNGPSNGRNLDGFPQVALFHGGKDNSIPSSVCDELYEVLTQCGVPVSSRVYPTMSHTDPILENLLAGETQLVDDITDIIERKYAPIYDDRNTKRSDRDDLREDAPIMVSKKLIYLARIMNPF